MEKFATFSHKILLVQVDNETCVILSELNSDNICLLVLKQVLGQNVSSLSVSLAPFLVLSIVKLKTKESFTELLLKVDPQEGINLTFFETE